MNKETFVEAALKQLGAPSILYRNPKDGISIEGFDCSGFIVFCLDEISFPYDKSIRHCNEFFDSFGVLVHEDFFSRGDLIFLSRDGSRPTHIGIMIDRKSYIHAPGTNDSKVCIEEIPREIIVPKNTKNSTLYSRNPIGFKRLTIPNGRWKTLLP